MKPTILYAEDDKNLAFVTRDHLEMQGFEVVEASDGGQALEAAKTKRFNLIILDIMMPVYDGFEVATKIREFDNQVPILFLTARSLQEDRIKGLKIGADDYILKPYSIEELVLKINIFLRRSSSAPTPGGSRPSTLDVGTYRFIPDQQRLLYNGEETKLTHKESEVLRILTQSNGQVVKREDILIPVWGNDDYYNGRSLDVFISKLRKHLSNDPRLEISNVHGIGFRLMLIE